LPVCGPEGLLSVHAGAERAEFRIEEGLLDPLEPFGGGLDGSGVAQMRESPTRPGPVSRRLDQPCANWIAEHRAEDRAERAVLLNRNTFEAALPHMPVRVVVPRVTADVAGHPARHERAEGRVGGRLHDGVNMSRHQGDAEERDGVLGFRGGEPVEQGGVVAVLVEDRGATVAAIQHMVDVSGHLSARNPRPGTRTVRAMGVGT
jgi:hypothetical protein